MNGPAALPERMTQIYAAALELFARDGFHETAMDAIQQKMKSGGGKNNGWFTSFLLRLEQFLDAGDAVRRRTQADRIHEDLIAERISRERAVTELQALTQRQKGGWLPKKFDART